MHVWCSLTEAEVVRQSGADVSVGCTCWRRSLVGLCGASVFCDKGCNTPQMLASSACDCPRRGRAVEASDEAVIQRTTAAGHTLHWVVGGPLHQLLHVPTAASNRPVPPRSAGQQLHRLLWPSAQGDIMTGCTCTAVCPHPTHASLVKETQPRVHTQKSSVTC